MPSVSNRDRAMRIITLAAGAYRVPVANLLKSRSRADINFEPRAIAMLLIYDHAQLTYQDIGRIFDKRHHTTVMNAVEKARLLLNHPWHKSTAQHIIDSIEAEQEEVIGAAVQKALALGLPATDWKHFVPAYQREVIGL